ncbi:MAG TPA: thioredoxin-like domain-containing protein [Gemmataceae bacterium]|nr:thioredoxin-like domain-containing protein [Gemmataceae bacterium]
MTKARLAAGMLSSCVLFWAGAASAASVEQMLSFRPKQEVSITTPTEQEKAACRVSWTPNARGGGAWLLLDPQGRPLRQFVDNKGDKKPHIWSYFKDGVEVYREIDTNFDGQPDQYRWLNSGGMKWGADVNHDHKIDTWKMISAEEASQEVMQAVVTRDFARVQALFITDAEMTALNLPPAESARIRESQKQAYAKFQDTLSKAAGLSDKTHWVHLETSPPQCLPADVFGTKQDVIKYSRGTILCETNGKNDWLQTGEMIKVGLTWRTIDAPTVGDGSNDSVAASTDPALQPLLDQLRDHDAKAPKNSGPGMNAQIVEYNLTRANLLEQIVAKVKPEEREQWIRQIADCLGAASQNSLDGDKAGYDRLVRLEEQLVKGVPGSNLAAYVTFREMQADNAARMSKPAPDLTKVQEEWLGRLTKFVSSYPHAEDTPEALMQLGMVSELVNKEAEARKWYQQLAKDFADHAMSARAQGALRRLDLEGKVMELAGPMLNGGATFNISQLRGKTVIVYYWASWNKDRCIGDFAVLKQLLDTYGSKGPGLELLCVNLDNTAEEANAFLLRSSAPGTHLFQPGGLDSPLATQYGIMVLPNLFLVDKEGKVVSRNTQQVGGLEEEIKKRAN